MFCVHIGLIGGKELSANTICFLFDSFACMVIVFCYLVQFDFFFSALFCVFSEYYLLFNAISKGCGEITSLFSWFARLYPASQCSYRGRSMACKAV